MGQHVQDIYSLSALVRSDSVVEMLRRALGRGSVDSPVVPPSVVLASSPNARSSQQLQEYLCWWTVHIPHYPHCSALEGILVPSEAPSACADSVVSLAGTAYLSIECVVWRLFLLPSQCPPNAKPVPHQS